MSAKPTTEHPLFRLAKLLFWTPILIAVPAFFIVGNTVPDLNHGSIGDGFRRLNVYLSAMIPVFAICWFAAIVMITYVELPIVPQSRLLIWLGVLIALVLLVTACWLAE